jgi:hypothetical protein
MSSILDNVTGGGLLPHVYCKKITLEGAGSKTKVTLSLRIYQEKNAIADSAWLNSFDVGGQNFMDSVYIQILPLVRTEHVKKLEPTHDPLTAGQNIFTAKYFYGDNFLPRWTPADMPNLNKTDDNKKRVFDWNFEDVPTSNNGPGRFQGARPPEPIQISNSSLLGNIASADALPSLETDGKVTTEVIDGKSYYVIPFEYTRDFNSDFENNLGFVFYTFLDVPGWLKNLGNLGSADLYEDLTSDSQLFEEFIVEGPLNAEIVFKNNKVHQVKEYFFIPSGVGNQGEFWEGSVHLHGPENPSPGGYSGDGGHSGYAGDFRGWMQGESHSSTQVQQKLKVVKLQNKKIQDLRGLGAVEGTPAEEGPVPYSGQEANLPEFDQILQVVGGVFQKEKKKDFIRDSDSEYSKLYITQDQVGNARGMFFFNIEELLKNNSSYFHRVKDLGGEISQIIDRSDLLELRLYRDRVKRTYIGPRREVFANDEIYEEPSKLLATISGKHPTAVQINNDAILSEFKIHGTDLGVLDSKKVRYFVFVDYDVSHKTAGLYQYRLEMKFKDGTWEYLNDLYNRLSFDKQLLDSYYELANSQYRISFPDEEEVNFSSPTSLYRSYYDKGVFTADFLPAAEAMFASAPYYPWMYEEGVGDSIMELFGLYETEWSVYCPDSNNSYINCPSVDGKSFLLDPQLGSPSGIEWYIRIIDKGIKKLGGLIGAGQPKTGNQYTNQLTKTIKNLNNVPNNYSLNASLNTTTAPSQYVIIEEHSFDHPKEFFNAMSNNNIFIDYLSVGSAPKSQNAGQPLRVMSINDFQNRCHLEAAVLSPKAKTLDSFDTLNTSLFVTEQGPLYGTQPNTDTFSTTGYSYLSPSIVNFFAPGNADSASNFSFSVYSPVAYSYLNSDEPVDTALSPFMRNGVSVVKDSLDSFFVTLLNYYSSKTNYVETDLFETYFSYENVDDVGPQVARQLAGREPYKRALENLGITVHDEEKHDLFFNKQPGAVSQDIIESDFTYKLQDFSDNVGFSRELFTKLITDNTDDINLEVNSPSTYLYDVNAPNSFKIGYISNNHTQFVVTEEPYIQPYLQNAYGTDASVYDSFHYFNLNLTVRVEVFTGIVGNAKDDEFGWTMLTKDILNNADNKLLFCRMSYYNEQLTRKINLPILDRYFLISGGSLADSAVQISLQLASQEAQMDPEENTQAQESAVEQTFNEAAEQATTETQQTDSDTSFQGGGGYF